MPSPLSAPSPPLPSTLPSTQGKEFTCHGICIPVGGGLPVRVEARWNGDFDSMPTRLAGEEEEGEEEAGDLPLLGTLRTQRYGTVLLVTAAQNLLNPKMLPFTEAETLVLTLAGIHGMLEDRVPWHPHRCSDIAAWQAEVAERRGLFTGAEEQRLLARVLDTRAADWTLEEWHTLMRLLECPYSDCPLPTERIDPANVNLLAQTFFGEAPRSLTPIDFRYYGNIYVFGWDKAARAPTQELPLRLLTALNALRAEAD